MISLLINWATSGDTIVKIPEEVVYGLVCGLFLLIQLIGSTSPIGGH